MLVRQRQLHNTFVVGHGSAIPRISIQQTTPYPSTWARCNCRPRTHLVARATSQTGSPGVLGYLMQAAHLSSLALLDLVAPLSGAPPRNHLHWIVSWCSMSLLSRR